jgi:cytochrome P450
MSDFFTDEMRRDPYPAYDRLRAHSPLFRAPPPFDAWLVLDYDGVKRVLGDPETFSSAVPAPRNWFLFSDPPGHTKQRALISRAFIPRVVTNLAPQIREFSRELLDAVIERGEMDLANEYAGPLAMKVIATLIGIPASEWVRFRKWSDGVLEISRTRSGSGESARAFAAFQAVTGEMRDYLEVVVSERARAPKDDLLTRLVEAEVDGERLSSDELLGFFQLLIVGGQETTANLIANAILCLIENPDQLSRLREQADLLPSAIEEVLRYRSPVAWLMRTPKRDVELHGQVIPRGALVLPMIGSANRDPRQFPDAGRFDITRDPNPHIAFGQGAHFCLGAPLARLEARIALADLLDRLDDIAPASEAPWEPRKALNVHGPERLPIRFRSRWPARPGRK